MFFSKELAQLFQYFKRLFFFNSEQKILVGYPTNLNKTIATGTILLKMVSAV